MRKIFLTGLLAIALLEINAQDFKGRIASLQQEYADLKDVHIVMKIEAYESKNSTQPFYTETATVKRSGNNSLTSMSGVEMMMNEKYLILVDKNSKSIACATRDTKAESKFYDPVKANLDSVLALYDQPILVNKTDQIEQYRVNQTTGVAVTLDLFIDTNKNQLTRLDYLYEDGHYVVIRFDLFDKSPSFDAQEFRETRYVSIVKGKMITAPKYSNFNLVVN